VGATGRGVAAAGIDIVLEPADGAGARAGAETGLSNTPQCTQNFAVG